MALLPYRLSAVSGSPIIWGERANLEFFLNGVTPVVGVGGLDKQVSYGGSSVSRYPGDPNPFSRKGGTRRIYLDKAGASVGTPGKRFWLEFINEDDQSKNEVRQFTVQGSMGLLRAQCKASVKIECFFRSSSGRKWQLFAVVPPLRDAAQVA